MVDFPTKYFDELERRIDAVHSPVDLQALASEAIGQVSALTAAIEAQIAALAPLLALLTLPSANPAAIVSWLTDFVTGFLTPYLKPHLTLTLQLPMLAARGAALVQKLEAKAAELEASITIPPLP